MTKKIAIIMDDPHTFHPEKDTTVGLILEAQKRGFELSYISIDGLYVDNTSPCGITHKFVYQNEKFKIEAPENKELDSFDYVLMRKDPPFDMRFFFSTHILSLCKKAKVVNRPSSLRNAPEKVYSLNFPNIFPPSLITSNANEISKFMENQKGGVILKPLDGCGGKGIVYMEKGDRNFSSIVEMSTKEGSEYIIVQEYLPEIRLGDKRVICINGEAKIALARIPSDQEHRANIHVGGRVEVQELTERDKWLVNEVSSKLVEDGLFFVGLDIIGNYITEINVTSPTGIREIKQLANIDLAKDFWDKIGDYNS